MAKPPVVATLTWDGDLRFTAESAGVSLVVDSAGAAGVSPVQMLAISLAACMAIDVALIVRKGRHPLTALAVSISANRADEPPRRILRAAIRFRLEGDVPAAAIERAIELSRAKYCSVWHSLREDIDLSTSYEIVA